MTQEKSPIDISNSDIALGGSFVWPTMLLSGDTTSCSAHVLNSRSDEG